jgi:hypothetical protein
MQVIVTNLHQDTNGMEMAIVNFRATETEVAVAAMTAEAEAEVAVVAKTKRQRMNATAWQRSRDFPKLVAMN